MTTNILNSFSLMRSNKLNYAIRAVLVVLLFTLGVGEAWGSSIITGKSYVKTETVEPAKGLVYCSSSNNANPSQSDYKRYYPGGSATGEGNEACYVNLGAAKSGVYIYCWAKPARGYEFDHWDGYEKSYLPYGDQNKSKLLDIDSWNGVKDQMVGTCGNGASTWKQHQAYFKPATSYTITYTPPVGGSYSVSYSYLKTRQTTGEEYEFYIDNSESYNMTPSSENASVKSYAADIITLSVPSETTNFAGWYEGTTQKSSEKSYTYPITKDATIIALFKTMSLGEATGDLSPAVEALGVMSPNPSITVPVTARGNWTANDFTVTFTENGSRGDVTKGTVTYTQNSGNVLSSTGTLTIPFTYYPSSWGNTEVNVTVSPKDGADYGNSIEFTIKASATQVLNYEACILLENETEPQSSNTGTLAEMVTKANTMDSKFTLQLAKDVTISSPLSLRKSMKFDLNDKTITSTGTSAFSIDAAGVDVQIVDEGFGGLGEVATQSAQSGNVSVVTFTQKAKLTMQGGTLSAKNTGSGSAYGINVTQGSTFYMTNGQLTVTASTGSAEGVHVATASDYATLNGGSVTVSAPSNAYGLWSAGQSNITDATIDVKTTTGTTGYGFYVNGGVTTLTEVATTVSVKTAGAGGGFVKAGRLNVNGGSIAVTAETSDVYGVYVAAGATANIQQNAIITAQATGASGTKVFGINNLGTVSLTNVSVTATSPTTAATAVNTATSAASTTIEGGIYRANTTGGTAYGLHHQYGALNVDGGEFKAIGSGNSIYGARATVDATIANATLWGETQGSGNTAYGFVGGVANKNITLTNCVITGLSATSKAYAIYSRTNVTATNCSLTATTTNAGEAYGLYAEAGTNKLTNCSATVTSNTTTAYGVNHVAGTLTIDSGEYDVTAKQATTSTAGNTLVYGVYNAASQTTTIKDASFTVTASNNACSQQVYGVYAKGILNSTNSTYTVTGRQQIWGVYGESTLNLSGNTISASASGVSTNGIKSYGIYAKRAFTFADNTVRATATSTNVYALLFDANTSEGTIADGKYYAMGNGTTDFAPLNASATVGKVKIQGGVYSTIVNIDKYLVSGYNVYNLDNEHLDFATGHRFIVADENPTPYVCYIKGGNKYTTLEAAMQYTKDNSGNYTIIMTQDYTLPEGDYELPSNATLLVPRNADQTSISGGTPARRTTKSITVENLRLTLASGAHINVNGKIEVGGEMFCAETGQICYVCSEYGRIHMEEGSLIQLNSGAVLYAWGYITGKGEIKAKNNSEVHEMFQIGDMKSMSSIGYYYYDNNEKFFLINQYSIQNIEVPTTYYYNSRSICAMASYYNGKFMGDDNIKLVGTSGALFLVTTNDESSWVRKSYDAENDYQVWDVNSSAQLGSITINFKEGVPVLGSAEFNSSSYYLPITNNMKIHVLDGDFAITQTSELLPGASVEIDKTASLTINSSKSVFVFDSDQWPFSITQVVYSPSWKNGTKPTRTKADAAVNVHGKIVVKGGLFTSSSITDGTNATNGANIYSNNEDAGTVSYSTAATASSSVKWVTGLQGSSFSTSAVYKTISMESAKLKNNNGSYTATAGTTSGEAWIYLNNVWQKTYTNGCFEVIGSTVYAKPSGYVALKKSQTVGGKLTGVEETNHTYLTAEDKILILMDECQWWEVVATSDPAVFKCEKEGYEGFYYYDNTTSKWKLKTVNVKFYSAETGDNVLKTIVTDYNGIPDQAVIATNPTKGTTAEYTYSFYGWKSSVTGMEYKWTDPLEVATADMSYRPVFTATKRNYTITLKDANNGANVPLEVPYGEKPSYEPIKDADAQYTYSFKDWTNGSKHYATCDDLPTVTGTATYTANWDNTVNNYNITWKSGNEILEVDVDQPYGTATAYNGTLPTKEADNEYAYTFSGWKSSLTGTTYANGSTPAVGGETTYEAQYNTTPRYAVTFANYDGSQLARTVYTQGETPAYDGVPTRKRDSDGYFKFIGWKNSNGTAYAPNATLPAVTKKETYTAQYDYVTDLFTITLNNVDGAGGTWSGKFGVGSIPFYNPNDDDVPVTPTKTGNVQYTYVFSSWSPAMIPVDGEATYTAVFSKVENKHSVSIKAGANGAVSPASVSGIGCETASADITATPDAGYAFNGRTLPDGVTAADGYTVVSNPIRIHAIAADKTITANFVARNDINYTVKHWQQNIADDDYTEVTADQETKQGTTATTTAATAKSYTGFTAQPFSQETIAGEGTTVVNIYYDRETYTIIWDVKLNGKQEAYKEETLRYGAMPSYGSTPTKEQTESQVFTFNEWIPEVSAVTGNQTYNGSFNVSPRQYTITFVNDDGTELWHSDFGYGSTPSYGGTPVTPVSSHANAGDGFTYTFVGWSPEITKVAGKATYTATYLIANIEVDANESKDVTVSASTTVTTVHVSGSLSVAEGKTLKTKTLVLEASPDGSGQITGDIDAEEAYLDYNLGGSQSGIWYDIAVPWEVDATNGVYIDGDQKLLNQDFYLIYYNGALRASQNRHTDECWQFVGRESTPDNHMHPGRLYMIYLPKAGVKKLRFKRDGDGQIVKPEIYVYQYDAKTVVNAGWNGIANPAIYKAYLNAGVEVNTSLLNYGQKYDPIHDRYDAFTMNNTKLNVSQPVFVQVEVNGNGTGRSVVVNASVFPNLAPVRKALVNNAAYEVQISDGTNYTDRLYLQSVEGKEDSYRIGLDLSKAGTSSKVAQMWINRYNTKLCVNTTAPVGTTATYPLGISVPSDGTYEITSATEMQDGQEIYVTYNGRAIWNLAYGPYAVTLNKGTYNEYGLKLVQKAPTITTGVETVSDERLEVSGVRKVLIDNTIYIICDGAVYTINGQQVK